MQPSRTGNVFLMTYKAFPGPPGDQRMIESCKTGDPRAFRQLYDAYSPAMFNICLRMLPDRHEAEDLLQEAFSKVFHSLDSYRGEASPGSWIKRIVVNTCISHLRKRRIRWEPIGDLEIPEEPREDSADFELSVSRILEAVRKLPDGYRTVLTLYLFEDYSHQEIAQMLGISTSTAKTQYMRAKEKVRKILSEDQRENHDGSQ